MGWRDVMVSGLIFRMSGVHETSSTACWQGAVRLSAIVQRLQKLGELVAAANGSRGD